MVSVRTLIWPQTVPDTVIRVPNLRYPTLKISNYQTLNVIVTIAELSEQNFIEKFPVTSKFPYLRHDDFKTSHYPRVRITRRDILHGANEHKTIVYHGLYRHFQLCRRVVI